MTAANHIVVNTLAQHIRSVFNICLSLYSTRIVLQALGQDDFGIYSLVASVVAMLGFLTNAMVITTQRQLSFYHGRGNADAIRKMFSNSLLLHIIVGFSIALILIALEPLLFNNFLAIDQTRIEAAKAVFFLVILSLLLTFLTAPYRALFIARENIVYLSVVDVLDGIIKLLAALWLLYCPFDRLISYAAIIAAIMAFNFIALAAWAMVHFEESMLLPRLSYFSKQSMSELTSFAGWTVYSVGCIVGRTQGVAIILNRFMGTAVNASYGIAQQVFGSVQFIAQSILNAISPQLIKAEGAGDRQRMFLLAELLSKYSFLLLSFAIIPLCFEIPTILEIWLGNVPPNTAWLCQSILIASLSDQLTIGLGTANQAIGKIRNYSLTINTIKVLTIPAMWCIMYLGYSLVPAMVCYILLEFICAMARLPFLKYTAGISIRHFLLHVFARVIPTLIIQIVTCWIVCSLFSCSLRFILTATASVIMGGAAAWYTALENVERAKALNMIFRRKGA